MVTSTPFNNARHIWKDLPRAKGDLDGYLNANYCATVRELARKHNLALCDLHEHWAARFRQNKKLVDELILPDGVHITDKGNEVSAELVAPYIAKLLGAGDTSGTAIARPKAEAVQAARVVLPAKPQP